MNASIQRLVVSLAIALAGTAVADPMSADCRCPPGSIEEGVRSAGKIFTGQIVEATFTGTTVEFTVEVDERFRGWVGKRQELRTAAPDNCGVPVFLGYSDLFVVPAGSKTVQTCTGSGRKAGDVYWQLSAAIAVVEFAGRDVARAVERLNRYLVPGGYTRTEMDSFFDLVGRLDPVRSMTRLDDRVELSGLVFVFRDDRLDREVHE